MWCVWVQMCPTKKFLLNNNCLDYNKNGMVYYYSLCCETEMQGTDHIHWLINLHLLRMILGELLLSILATLAFTLPSSVEQR